jgi:hypothetical protein
VAGVTEATSHRQISAHAGAFLKPTFRFRALLALEPASKSHPDRSDLISDQGKCKLRLFG